MNWRPACWSWAARDARRRCGDRFSRPPAAAPGRPPGTTRYDARRLEAAWLALESEVEAEQGRWAPEIDAIAAWRPALWPVFVFWIPLAVLLVWLGLILGGYVPAPQWLAAPLGF